MKLIGLTNEAKEFVKDLEEDPLNFGLEEGWSGEPVVLAAWKKDGKVYREVVEYWTLIGDEEPYLSTCLECEGTRLFTWRNRHDD